MGYYSTLEGELVITNPLNSPITAEGISELTGILMSNGTFGWALDGQTPSVSSNQIAYSLNYAESGKYYNLADDLDLLAADLNKAGFTLNGSVIRAGEENGDLEKFVINNNVVRNYKVKVTFGDGTEYTA